MRRFLALVLLAGLAVGGSQPARGCPLHHTEKLAIDILLPGLRAGLARFVDAAAEVERLLAATASEAAWTPVDGAPGEVGRWRAPREWPVMAIHAAVLPTGDVLQWSYPWYVAEGTDAELWNPRTGAFRDSNYPLDLYCGGHSYLADGTIYVTGGNRTDGACGQQGRNASHLFDPFTSEWIDLGPMARARWYPSNVTLGDGRVIVMAGLDDECEPNPVVERFTPGEGLEILPQAERAMELYPRVHLLPSGKIAHVGPEPVTRLLDPETGEWERVARTRYGKLRLEGTSFLVPGKPWQVMLCGGFPDYDADPTASCERINFRERKPRWRSAAPLNMARAHGEPVVLPDGKVLLTGGGTSRLFQKPVYNPEIYDPETDSWALLPRLTYGRPYHSTSVLLPDGRVLVAGTDRKNLRALGVPGESAEIYHPAYLFRGKRPGLKRVPEGVGYGDAFSVRSGQAGRIESAALIRLSAITHSVNTTQRYVPLGLERAAGKSLRLTAPDNPNAAPPGYYMLFLVNDRGVPSKGKMVRLAFGSSS